MIKPELDTYYITRSGERVKYVGRSGSMPDVPPHYCFRQADEHIFCVLGDGMFWGKNGQQTDRDIIGMWENDCRVIEIPQSS